ncbi:MAG: YkgJ family cysteine cluster protein [Myxococcota bacterium]
MTGGLLRTLLAALLLTEWFTRGAMTRRVWREVARFFILMELWALQLVRWVYPPKYVITGQCHKRGTCCTAIVGDPPRLIKRRPRLLALFAAYHRTFHNFEVVARGPNEELIFACGHLQSDGRCGIYKYRPLLCRNYPILPFFEPPRPIPGCGYGVAARVASTMQKRSSLPIVNPQVIIHHPTRSGGPHRMDQAEDYEWIDPGPL